MGEKLGQHFLTNVDVVQRIAALATEGEVRTVLEIGTGRGALTHQLGQTPNISVVTVEYDAELAARMVAELGRYPNVRLVNADARTASLAELGLSGAALENYRVVGNFPYYATQPLLQNFLSYDPPPREIVCMLQEEVVDSFTAPAGRHTFLGIWLQIYGAAEKLLRVHASDFNPRPKVGSAVMRVKMHAEPRLPRAEIAPYIRFVRACFKAPRKRLANAMQLGLTSDISAVKALLERAEIAPDVRAANLTTEQYIALYELWRTEFGGRDG